MIHQSAFCCLFVFQGRRHIAFHNRISCERNFRRRIVFPARSLWQHRIYYRRCASYRGQLSTRPNRRRHEILDSADFERWLVFMRHRRVVTKKIIDQRDLARVQQGKRELAKVAEGPKQINALPKGGFDGNYSLLRLEQQEARFKLVQKHRSPPRHRMQLA